MTLAYAIKLGPTIWKTSIGAQNINDLSLGIYDMVLAKFLFLNNLKRVRFFKTIFLLANTSMKMIPKKSFLFFSNTNIEFAKRPEKLT